MLAAGEGGVVDSPGMGEFKVHRVRFFNYVPSGIRCVAYNDQSNRLAVSRTDGTVEIYNLSANYFQEKVGCEDGSVKLFQVTPEKIQFERNFDRQKRSAIHKMLVDRQYMGVSKRKCIIWGVAFLSDGTVISVDSAGKVQFWDSATGTLVKNHLIANADVQSIAVSDQEDSFVVGTAEGTVFHFQLVSVTSNSSEKQWVRTKPFQHHTHDVRAVAHSPTALISGGTDTHLVIRPLMEKVEVKNYDAALRKITFPHILFSEDSTKLFVASNQGSLHVIRLLEGSFKHLHTFQPQSGTVESMCLLAVSPDGNWLAASGTSAGVHVYSVKHLKLHCTVPAYNFPVTALAIAPNTNNLVIAHSDQQVFEYSIPDKQYTEWSRTIQKQGFHHLWLQRDTPITHISFHPKRPMHILLHDAYMFCIIDKSLPLLFMELLDERTLVAVERPLDDIIAQLPPPIKKKKFGT
ncbi:hypothetical protein CB1_000490019 [Camelus ferus]|nr:hypothetical protein CB1_000490019 [Camelus ferus]